MRSNFVFCLTMTLLFLARIAPAAAQSSEAPKWRCSRIVANDANFSDGPGLAWTDRSIDYAFNGAGAGAIGADAAASVVAQAFATWSRSTLQNGLTPDACSSALNPNTSVRATDITFNASSTDQNFVGYNFLAPENNRNLVIFRDKTWDHPNRGYFAGDYIALTTVTYSTLTGAILDADIEFNSRDFQFTTTDSTQDYDLLSTAIHEIGHLLGFGHSSDATAAMYLSTQPGETGHRALSCYDAAGLWFRYPAGAALGICNQGQVDNDCGLCQGPGTLGYTADAKVIYTNDGHGGCDCTTLGPDGYVLCLLACVVTWARSRRGSSRRAFGGGK